jgi:uncharacterized phage protein (predicted DNA packaging)
MVTLQELKDFARIDGTDDDALVTSLGVAAQEYIEQATGKTFTDPMPERAALAIKALVATWYEQRGPVVAREKVEGVSEISYRPNTAPAHVRALIHQLRDWTDPELVEVAP